MMISGVLGDRASGNGLPAELTGALVSLWTQYAGKPPSRARTEIRGNLVTCVLVDAVGDYNRSMITPQTGDTVGGVGKLTACGLQARRRRGGREADAPTRYLVRQQPRPGHGCRHGGIHPGAIVQPGSTLTRRQANGRGFPALRDGASCEHRTDGNEPQRPARTKPQTRGSSSSRRRSDTRVSVTSSTTPGSTARDRRVQGACASSSGGQCWPRGGSIGQGPRATITRRLPRCAQGRTRKSLEPPSRGTTDAGLIARRPRRSQVLL